MGWQGRCPCMGQGPHHVVRPTLLVDEIDILDRADGEVRLSQESNTAVGQAMRLPELGSRDMTIKDMKNPKSIFIRESIAIAFTVHLKKTLSTTSRMGLIQPWFLHGCELLGSANAFASAAVTSPVSRGTLKNCPSIAAMVQLRIGFPPAPDSLTPKFTPRVGALAILAKDSLTSYLKFRHLHEP